MKIAKLLLMTPALVACCLALAVVSAAQVGPARSEWTISPRKDRVIRPHRLDDPGTGDIRHLDLDNNKQASLKFEESAPEIVSYIGNFHPLGSFDFRISKSIFGVATFDFGIPKSNVAEHTVDFMAHHSGTLQHNQANLRPGGFNLENGVLSFGNKRVDEFHFEGGGGEPLPIPTRLPIGVEKFRFEDGSGYFPGKSSDQREITIVANSKIWAGMNMKRMHKLFVADHKVGLGLDEECVCFGSPIGPRPPVLAQSRFQCFIENSTIKCRAI